MSRASNEVRYQCNAPPNKALQPTIDPGAEAANPINPIAGKTVLEWLGVQLSESFSLTAPDHEDWGWYSLTEYRGAKYLVGASGDTEASPPIEWTILVDKQRVLIDRAMGEKRQANDDPVAMAIHEAIERMPEFNDVTCENDA